MYLNENMLTDDFIKIISEIEFDNLGYLNFNREFFFGRGKTDVVAVNDSGEIISFELKLERWKQAMQQAYRNTCFSNYSYVVLPKETAARAIKFCADFEIRSIGLCSISENRITVEKKAERLEPLQEWLYNKATIFAQGEEKNVKSGKSI